MDDLVIKGTGNSRYLKSVENFKALYPTYDDFAAALVAGKLPIDLNGLNAAGITQDGTPICKETLLTYETEALLELQDPESGITEIGLTVNDALAQLRKLDVLKVGPITVTVPVSGWVSENTSGMTAEGTVAGAPYVQTIYVSGIRAGDTHLDLSLAPTTDVESGAAQRRAFGCITEAETFVGGIKLRCRQMPPDVSMQCILRGVREYGTN